MEGFIRLTLARDPRGKSYGEQRHFHASCVPQSWFERREIELRMHAGFTGHCTGCGKPFKVRQEVSA